MKSENRGKIFASGRRLKSEYSDLEIGDPDALRADFGEVHVTDVTLVHEGGNSADRLFDRTDGSRCAEAGSGGQLSVNLTPATYR